MVVSDFPQSGFHYHPASGHGEDYHKACQCNPKQTPSRARLPFLHALITNYQYTVSGMCAVEPWGCY